MRRVSHTGTPTWPASYPDSTPPTAQRTLFQPFARGAAADGTIGGTALGLYIVRQIVEGHGGGITLASAPGVGTTVTLTLPLAPPEVRRGQREGNR